MEKGLFGFLGGDAGAVSADWVVLTAGAAMMAVTTIVLVTQSTSSISRRISGSIATVDAEEVADDPQPQRLTRP